MFVLLAGKINFYDNVHGSIKILGKYPATISMVIPRQKTTRSLGKPLCMVQLHSTYCVRQSVDGRCFVMHTVNIVDSMSEHSSAFIERIKTQAKRNLSGPKRLKKKMVKELHVILPQPSDLQVMAPPTRKFYDRSPNTTNVLLKSRDVNLSLSRASSILHHKSKRRFKRADVELLLKSAYISHKFIQAHLDSIPWDPVDQSISEGELLQDPMLSPVFNDTLAIKDMQSFVTEVEKIFKCVMREVHGGHNASYIGVC